MASHQYQMLLSKGTDIINRTFEAQSKAVANLQLQYKTDGFSQANLSKSLDLLLSTNINGGKIVLCGVGKSFKVACKLCATLNSLSIQSVTLHPTEALHGDLGILGDRDIIVMLTASGNTPELITLLPHISNNIPIILLTCNKDSKLALNPMVKSLLYTELPPHLKEETIHGIPAPTVSATLSLIMADSVILALAELIEGNAHARKKQFSMKHPGGSIGANLSHLNDNVNLSGSKSKTQSSSYSSFLSLDDLRASLGSNNVSNMEPTSLISSDDEIIDKDSILRVKFNNTPPSKVISLSNLEIKTIEEPKFLRFITLYDFISTRIKDQIFVIDSNTLKELYVKNVNDGSEWNDFASSLLSSLKPLSKD